MIILYALILSVAIMIMVLFVMTAPVGTKSLLFGVHQFLLHPYCVLRAWIELYGWPSWRELVCIIIHDWGYWGRPNMDGPEGERHPLWAAHRAYRWFDGPFSSSNEEDYYRKLCLYHSRHFARRDNADPSTLCWADKLSIKYAPTWLYLLLANLSGEIEEYREKNAHVFPLEKSNREWHEWVKAGMIKMAMEQNAGAMPYMQD